MIDKSTIDNIVESAKIVEVIQQFVTLKKKGISWLGLCPFHNEKTSSFTVTPSKKIYKCFGCGKSGDVIQFLMEHEHYNYPEALRYLGKMYNIEVGDIKAYEKPKWGNSTSIDEKAVKWFESRGLSQETINHFKIGYGNEFMPQKSANVNVVMFPYFKNGECVNIKYRDGAKNFKMAKNAELVFFNMECTKDFDEVYVTEGELDAMTLHQCGFPNVISVPNGAGVSKNNLQYIDNSFVQIEMIKRFHIATDNDAAGRRLREDLLERFGIDKCDYIIFKDCKDANDCLLKYGQGEVALACNNKQEFPIEGVFTMKDFADEVEDYYINGLPKGNKTGMDKFDKLISFHKGYLCVITGIPGHGKSSVLDQIMLMLALNCGWKGAFYSPENRPTRLHISKLIRLITGKHWEGDYRMSYIEVERCMEYLNEKLFFIKPEKDFTLDSILKSVAELKLKYGMDMFAIDAWNKLEHKDDKTTYVGAQLDKISDFCDRHQVVCFLVAHPTKMKKVKDKEYYEVPTLYDISGSANFFNKADLGISVYRNFTDKKVSVIVQKVKFNHWGETGSVEFEYDFPSGRFYEDSKVGKFVGNWMFQKQATQEDVFQPKPMPRNMNGVGEDDELKFAQSNEDNELLF